MSWLLRHCMRLKVLYRLQIYSIFCNIARKIYIIKNLQPNAFLANLAQKPALGGDIKAIPFKPQRFSLTEVLPNRLLWSERANLVLIPPQTILFEVLTVALQTPQESPSTLQR